MHDWSMVGVKSGGQTLINLIYLIYLVCHFKTFTYLIVSVVCVEMLE